MTPTETKLHMTHERANQVKQDIYDLRKDGTIGKRENSDVIAACNRILKSTDYDALIFTKDWAKMVINYKKLYDSDIMEKLKAFLQK